MYGLPTQSITQWNQTLDSLTELSPEHISLYALTIEENTPMDRWLSEGKIPEPDPDLAADMYEYACESLAKSGYHHYEISNWSLAGRACRHNLVYWKNDPYLGVGPGAHSRLGNYRFWTILSPREYNIRSANWSESDTVSAGNLRGRPRRYSHSRRMGTYKYRDRSLGDDVPRASVVGWPQHSRSICQKRAESGREIRDPDSRMR